MTMEPAPLSCLRTPPKSHRSSVFSIRHSTGRTDGVWSGCCRAPISLSNQHHPVEVAFPRVATPQLSLSVRLPGILGATRGHRVCCTDR